MSLMEKNIEKYGEICKWLTCSYDCKFTDCALNKARVDYLFYKFKEKGFKYPNVAYCYASDNCTLCDNGDYISGKGYIDDYDEDSDITKKEKEALEIAKQEFSKESNIEKLYKSLKSKFANERISELKKQIQEYEEMLKEDYNELLKN